ncbi:unnamed protein product [Notodromas monacha]|uniref:PDZ domain-containing protein n=1 Tax=Notodromas monacha TaxID=399045 RepID=A0A7R9BSR2_9CRUS|nr:unnamed protein product [Notodromas monacha]CAG0919671.1 unnamed protein product [Notodromas monacha]
MTGKVADQDQQSRHRRGWRYHNREALDKLLGNVNGDTMDSMNRPANGSSHQHHHHPHDGGMGPQSMLHHDGGYSGPTEWRYQEIVLERGNSGLGFSIAGGKDNPHVEGDNSIYITKIIPGGAASNDGRLLVNDIIVKVNDCNVVEVLHVEAVDALKRAGNIVKLLVKRRVPRGANLHLLEVDLRKGTRGLGFSIAGGIGNQHIPGDNGIYVTKIMEGGAAHVDGRVVVGDKLVAVKNTPVSVVFAEGLFSLIFRSAIASMLHHDGGYSGPTEWRYQEIVLERGNSGLGFSIAGGKDNPHVEGDNSIYITKIIPGGAASNDGRLLVNDIIVKVNDCNVVEVLHVEAVDALKRAGNIVKLLVKRRVPRGANLHLLEVDLRKGTRGLGFSIAGGIGNQHIPGDNGIYVTKIMEGGAAHVDGRVVVGDKLVAVKNTPVSVVFAEGLFSLIFRSAIARRVSSMFSSVLPDIMIAELGDVNLENVSHESAVAALKSIVDHVTLVVAKQSPPDLLESFMGAGGLHHVDGLRGTTPQKPSPSPPCAASSPPPPPLDTSSMHNDSMTMVTPASHLAMQSSPSPRVSHEDDLSSPADAYGGMEMDVE